MSVIRKAIQPAIQKVLYGPLSAPYGGEPILLLIGGQSNSGTDPNTGRQDFTDMPTYLQTAPSNVQFYDIALDNVDAFAEYVPASGRQMGWIDQMLREVAPHFSTVRVCKRAVGGTVLAREVGADAYPRADFKNRATAAIALMDSEFGAGNYTTLVLWNQGESDGANSTDAGNYQTNLTDWFAEIRSDVGDFPIIFNKLSDYQTEDFPEIPTIQSAQDAVAALSTSNILVDGSTIQVDEQASDFSHYSVQGYINLGNLFSTAVLTQASISRALSSPTLVSAEIPSGAPGTIVLTFSKSLAPVDPYWDDITLSSGRQVIEAAVSGTSITLTVSEPYYTGVSETIAYAKGSLWTNYIQDQNGGIVADFAATSVTNNSADSAPTRTTVYEPDWSSGVASWSVTAATLTGGESVGGRTGVLKLTKDGTNGPTTATAPSGIDTAGPTYKISVDLYIDYGDLADSQISSIGVQIRAGVGATLRQFYTLNYFPRYIPDKTWTTVSFAADASAARPSIQFSSMKASGAAYFDNLVIERLS